MNVQRLQGRLVSAVLQRDKRCADRPVEFHVRQSQLSGAEVGIAPPDMPLVKTFIVEDSPIILDNLVATLEEMAPVQVVGSAPDESTAMQRLAQLEGVDLVIIDVFLKSGSGLGVLRGTSQTGLRAKRVVLTNYATPDMREKCKALGANRVFDKSNDLDDLISYCTRLADSDDTSSGTLS